MGLRPHFKGHGKYYLLIYFGPALFVFLSGAFYFLLFPAFFDPELTVLQAMIAPSATPGLSATALLTTQLLIFVTVGPIINILPTMGEELGWRGYLLPKLRLFLSDRAALVVSGAIWGIWHAPVIAMGHNYGTGYIGYPWLGILAMIVFCVSLGVIEGYLTIKLASVIPAAMIHSAINAGGGFPIYLAKSGYNPLFGPAAVGLVGGLPLMILAAILLIKTGAPPPSGKNNLQP